MNQPAKPQLVDTSADSELARVRAERAKLLEQREARLRAGEAAQRLADEKLALANEQAVEAAEQEIGAVGVKIAVVNTVLGVVILKRPHAATFRKFQDRGKTDSKYLYELVKPCLVYPSLADFELVCDELAATLLRCADAVSGLAGVRAEELSGKS